MVSRTTFLIVSALALIVGAGAATCPASGVVCYPSDCCAFYQHCDGSTFFAVQPTPAGTVCKGGYVVWASDCTTPCSQAPATTAPSQAPATQAPATQAPATQAPTRPATQAPVTQAPTRPATQAPTQEPEEDCEDEPTPAPTTAPTQKATTAPTQKATAAPTQQATAAPTQKATAAPTQKATTAPTAAPTQKATTAPTAAPTQKATAAPTQKATVPPTSGCNLAQIFTQADFNALFPHANGGAINGLANQHPIFTYDNIIAAAAYYPDFACTGDVTTRKRELAAFLAHTSQESSGWWAGQPYQWGYYFSTEVGCTNALCTMYCDQWNTQYPCVSGKSYYGRGPIQLSWNYNYGAASQAIFGDSKVLLNDPDQIFSSGVTAFRTALWFWMTPQNPKPSCHDVISGVWSPSTQDRTAGRLSGFGLTTNIINGGIECNHATPQQVINRVSYFQVYTARFGVTTGDNLYCDKMQSY